MINWGSKGDMSLFYDGKLIVSKPLTETKTRSYYFTAAEQLLIDGLKGGESLLDLRKRLTNFMKAFSKESKYWREIELKTPLDRDIIFYTGLMLIKMNVIDADGVDEGILIMKTIKPKKGNLARRQ